ncbi:MAG TPA: hypothetical protein VIK87_07945 [Sphingomonadales bacterium]
MNQKKIAVVLVGLAALGAGGVLGSLGASSAGARAARADLPMVNVTRIENLAAGQDGAAWATTTDGRLLHCRFDGNNKRVRCFDRQGETSTAY